MSYTKKRYLVYIFITILTFTLPFITIDNNHILLLSFDKLQFHFFGFVYNVNELYIMPFLLMFLFIGIFAMTAIFGRVWCGWACPQTIFRTIYRDLIESTILDMRRIKNKQKDVDYSKKSNLLKKYISIFLWLIITIVISTNFMWYFVPPEDFFLYMQTPSEHMFMIIFILSIAIFLIYDIVFMKENFCVYICPYSRIQSVLYDDDTKQIVYDTSRGGDVYVNREKSIFKMKEWTSNQECTTCEACVKICPTNIDIRKGLQVECINCLECSDACSIVMGKLGKKSLINWGSTNSVINKKISTLLTKRNMTYFVSLILCIILAIVFASKKEPFLLNVNKTTNLYKIKEDQKVTNNYILTFHNTQNKAYTFDIKLEDSENFRIKRFKPFKLEPNKRIKKIFIVETKKRLFISKTKDTPLKIKINSFALENKEIVLSKELSFVYPRSDLIK
ncbi:cytochrome c oxidase accessory protein CcoG [Poseidonibacter lekithochrous]|uniref:cytochrome c oxidase accessory protein CcoG n=1 Tax=Poseidonibacter TaxID=2321187 RepID=UPI001C08AD97|nr:MULTISPECIES: cytochrome c oxidase accessory protein CcoG [Poseidonibacter]MBU3015263.1 cytochrome c oxidase accessory protein CcoG [Poseidonibacter lekithochrous]MDO6828561.1 cytochrome c oxidase accessory protein CcoG [Poseidonibacter sp. 1_MG-2023]